MSNSDPKELTIKTIAEIVNHLISSYEKGEHINLTKLKNHISRKYKLAKMPKLTDIISALPDSYRDKLTPYLKGGPDSDFEYSTQSYTGYEPTSMRAIRARYNPFIQTKDRIEQLKKLGHDTDKVEFIIMGGTFMSLQQDYR